MLARANISKPLGSMFIRFENLEIFKCLQALNFMGKPTGVKNSEKQNIHYWDRTYDLLFIRPVISHLGQTLKQILSSVSDRFCPALVISYNLKFLDNLKTLKCMDVDVYLGTM